MASTTAFTGSVPANYEQYLGPFLFEPYATDLIQRLPKGILNNVLEIACGTGRVTRHLVAALADGGNLVATDLNPDMISVAQQKVTDSRVQWQVADAQELPFEDETFDAVVCQYGVMFFPDKAKAFAETYRVLKKGGRFIFNTWDNVTANPPVAIIDKVLKQEFGEATAPKFFENAPYSFFDRELIKTLLKEASFNDIKVELVQINSSYSDPDVVIKGFLDGTPLFTYLAEKDAAKREAVRKKIRQELINSFGESSDKVGLQAFVCEGVK